MDTRPTDSAFPFSYHRDMDSFAGGMSKREYFAIMMMQAMTTNNVEFEDIYQKARAAVVEADALIAVLNEELVFVYEEEPME